MTEEKERATCEICNEREAKQTCKECGRKFCPSCRSPYAGVRPVCIECSPA